MMPMQCAMWQEVHEDGFWELLFNTTVCVFVICHALSSLRPAGVKELELTLPSSITKWMIQGISVSPTSGMCVAKPLNVTVIKSFFVDIRLPVKAVRGEQLEVKVTVYNFGIQDVRVSCLTWWCLWCYSWFKTGARGNLNSLSINLLMKDLQITMNNLSGLDGEFMLIILRCWVFLLVSFWISVYSMTLNLDIFK